MFSGIGAQERGFRNSNLFDLDVLTTSDIDKEAVVSYAAVHCGLTPQMINEYPDYPTKEEMARHLSEINLGYDFKKNKPYNWDVFIKRKGKTLEKYWLACKVSNNLGDISKIDDLPYADFWTVSFPCTDISVAGQMKGLKPDSNTRSSLLWENVRLLQKSKEDGKLPKYIMFENVKNLVGKKFINDFNDLLKVLEELGFNSYWKVINGKDCGIPQNRERVFVISIRKDLDTKQFKFPIPFDNGLRLVDILEDKVDKKYYLSDEIVSKFNGIEKFDIKNKAGMDKSINDTKQIEYANCITTREDRGVSNRKAEGAAVVVQNPHGYNKGSVLEECPAITSSAWQNNNFVQKTTTRGSEVASTVRATIYKQGERNLVENVENGRGYEGVVENSEDDIRIRKLTPKECWRLMGFEDEDIEKAAEVSVKNSHLYKQAGNSIITNCVELLAEHLYKAQYNNSYICFDENFIQPQQK